MAPNPGDRERRTSEMNKIRKVAVLGAGVMGSGIAAHLANAGVPSLLLDIVLPEPSEDEKKKGWTRETPEFRNKLAVMGKENAIKAKPAALHTKEHADLITTGNLEDDLPKIAGYDWVIEVVKEDLGVKQALFKRVAQHFKPGQIISSNTSGIPIEAMTGDLPKPFQQHFLVTHFFNPVRYMKLLELVPGKLTRPEIMKQMADFGERVLGKGIVYGKDTPNFVANRIGVYGILATMKTMTENGYQVDEVDKILGKAMGKPGSAVFKTADLVGNDTLAHISDNVLSTLQHDAAMMSVKSACDIFYKMRDKKLWGNKVKQGFYKRGESKKEKFVIDYNTWEYRPEKKYEYESLDTAKNVEDVGERIKGMVSADDRAGKFAWMTTAPGLIYAAGMVGEITDDIVNIDNAMKWGFAWEMGPFEAWDAIGVKESVERMEKEGLKVPQNVKDFLAAGNTSFYKVERCVRKFWDFETKSYKAVPVNPDWVLLSNVRLNKNNIVRENFGATLWDIGDGVLNVEFHTKMNSVDVDVITMLNDAIDIAERDGWKGIVLANENTQAFSAGANIMMLLGEINNGNWDGVNQVVKAFQDVNMRLRYSDVPTVAAPAGLVLGGGLEMVMACDAVQAYGEMYSGLVEAGVGLIPGGGGNLRMLERMLESMPPGTRTGPFDFNYIAKAFEYIATVKISMSAGEARNYRYIRYTDGITLSRDHLIADAKRVALHLHDMGYKRPAPRKYYLPGKSAYATIMATVKAMKDGEFISEHDAKIAGKVAHVLTGGDTAGTVAVSEQYLLDLEREAFLSLCGEEKTKDRIMYMLMNNKPLRN
jgi:3-hydroxyacyl-CoA dehydrogenase